MNIKAILGLTSVGLMLFTMYQQNNAISRQKDEIKALKITIQKQDSINADQYTELFQATSQLGRYQMALEILKDGEDLKAARTFEHILRTQTE